MLRKIMLLLTLSLSHTGAAMAFDYKSQNDAFWREKLDPTVYEVCRNNATEAPGSGKYDKFYKKGTYYCACCGGDFPLYSSASKFDSGTGWPSFYAPLENAVIEQPDPHDKTLGLFGAPRIEVLCSRCGSHLGHVFDDGPKPTGKRYCMNSTALNFAPAGEKPKRSFEVNDKNGNAK